MSMHHPLYRRRRGWQCKSMVDETGNEQKGRGKDERA